MTRMRSCLLALALIPSAAGAVAADFSGHGLDGWKEKSFDGHTRYDLVTMDDRQVLHASCDGGASVLYHEQRIDLRRTPILRWSWRVDAVYADIDERSKAGDDYPARVYVVVDGGLLPWRTLAVNYVWASEEPAGADWPNAFVANAKMLALRSGTTDAGRWQTERRDVREDFRRLQGRDIEAIDGIAVMTDCDNTGGHAEAWYGDLSFAADKDSE